MIQATYIWVFMMLILDALEYKNRSDFWMGASSLQEVPYLQLASMSSMLSLIVHECCEDLQFIKKSRPWKKYVV
jgi:hypothetical protein